MEINELIDRLKNNGCDGCLYRPVCAEDDTSECAIRIEAAATIEQLADELEKATAERDAAIQNHPVWIPVAERLPKNEVDVLICAERRGCRCGTYHVVSVAFHTDGKMTTEESCYNWDSDVAMQRDEETDAKIIPEGWWETVTYGEEFGAVYDFVTHWMPLPEPPKEEGR